MTTTTDKRFALPDREVGHCALCGQHAQLVMLRGELLCEECSAYVQSFTK